MANGHGSLLIHFFSHRMSLARRQPKLNQCSAAFAKVIERPPNQNANPRPDIVRPDIVTVTAIVREAAIVIIVNITITIINIIAIKMTISSMDSAAERILPRSCHRYHHQHHHHHHQNHRHHHHHHQHGVEGLHLITSR
jgi:hypothetical protein